MRIRNIYLWAGIAWALLLGPAVMVGVVAMGAGLAWIYLFGDEPWPAAANSALIGAGILAGALAALFSVIAGYRLGKSCDGISDDPADTGRRRAQTLLALPVCLLVFAALAIWLRAQNYREEMTRAANREAAFAVLAADARKVVAISIKASAPDSWSAEIEISSGRSGLHELQIDIVPSSSRTPVLTERRVIEFDNSVARPNFEIHLDDLRDRYRALILGGRGGALVDENFILTATLDPVLSEQEKGNLPPGEIFRLSTPESPLVSRRSAEFPVRFVLP